MEGEKKVQPSVSAEFLQERTTKRMVRFYEVDNGSGDNITGTIYFNQSALRKLDYQSGDTLVVTLTVKKGAK